ncbi:outer membrane protein [Palleronia pelagia]|uniref:Opacity protein n=1 Tax=Palleronia pelagia TaxID=387096 RepID=A0A1H8BHB7_9RHOB|nr:outer membrane beta-barrel protein [Palleronia pelagia]SEM82350.1 Opacity protein [Palleronia pelagia]
MKLLTVSAAAIVAASTAFAGGIETAPAPVAPLAPLPPVSIDWTGAYAGTSLGYGTGDIGTLSDPSGEIAGVFAGYNVDFGNTVVGAELDLNAANIDDEPIAFIDRVHRLKVKAGYGTGAALFYGTVGGAYASGEVGGASVSDNGYLYGVGVDYAVSDRFHYGLELLRHEFDDFDNSGVDVDATTLQARFGYRF